MTSGDRIKLIRGKLGVSQRVLAQVMHMPAGTLSSVESNDNHILYDITALKISTRLKRYCEVDVTPEWLQHGTGEQPIIPSSQWFAMKLAYEHNQCNLPK